MPSLVEPAVVRERGVKRWERLCDPTKGCGVACCHYEGSPCTELDVETQRCRVYATRFGKRQTVEGKTFKCASMADWLMHKPAPEHCGYSIIRSIEGIPVVRGMA